MNNLRQDEGTFITPEGHTKQGIFAMDKLVSWTMKRRDEAELHPEVFMSSMNVEDEISPAKESLTKSRI